ncbi:hypothetical protein HMPREF9078_01895 [Capnocytophaga sp. oral taxon 380 str. F0488]|uniref:Uncharacterized protein n=1 Tax=Siphoviridae sp. ctYaH2 TaxID=2825549 RepID=A0A8S5V591_9CAUD|nr:hypothetical protein C3V44_08980 [Capnocytophaga sp. oral taxon 864]EKY05359.1 hypothetical protein HMPREF9078_01895 [Capnocytophaga sp. oral taxon 380 str. F0488]EKY13248.1 hypothetical protein HMPREF9072_01578 [Capnocytophaga sp. oral taxon 324 str. F0483]DAG01913.1 MAG TPA: hypothetical protein [Siphoviridae sp. ctYaH2]DAI34751.1 MAG TPA: hypothetical protein [Bacteriophage sp.]
MLFVDGAKVVHIDEVRKKTFNACTKLVQWLGKISTRLVCRFSELKKPPEFCTVKQTIEVHLQLK